MPSSHRTSRSAAPSTSASTPAQAVVLPDIDFTWHEPTPRTPPTSATGYLRLPPSDLTSPFHTPVVAVHQLPLNRPHRRARCTPAPATRRHRAGHELGADPPCEPRLHPDPNPSAEIRPPWPADTR